MSASTARKYFGNENAVGQTLINRNSDNPETFEVTGVYKDFPDNSHLILNYLVSYQTLQKELNDQGDKSNASETAWGWYDYYVYVRLNPGVDFKTVEAKMPAFTDKYLNSKEKTHNERTELHLIPLEDIHLYSNYNQEAEVNGNGGAVAFLFLIAIFIMCIAWINYINLATARSVERAKEVGVEKYWGR